MNNLINGTPARRVTVIGSGLLLLYYIAYLLALPPTTYFGEILPSGEIRVVSGPVNSSFPKPGDIITEINGQSTRVDIDWRSPLEILGEGQTLTVQRDGTTLTEFVPFDRSISMDPTAVRVNYLPLAFALGAWAAGSLALWRASAVSPRATIAGLTLVALGISVAAISMTRLLTPFTRTPISLLFPLASVAFAILPVLATKPLSESRFRTAFRFVYLPAAIILSLLLLVQTFLLSPFGVQLREVVGVGALTLSYLLFAVCAVTNLALTLVGLTRAWRQGVRREFQQYRILAVAGIVAFVPIIVLLIVPFAVAPNMPAVDFVTYELPFLTLALYPAGFLYAVLRHNYLQLDVRVTRFVQGLILLVIFTLGYAATVGFAFGSGLGIGLSATVVLAYFGLALLVGSRVARPTWQFVRRLLYGGPGDYAESLNEVAGLLTSDPGLETIRAAISKIDTTVVTSTASRLLVKNGARWTQRVGEPLDVDNPDWSSIEQEIVVRDSLSYTPNRPTQRVFETLPWLEAIVPLQVAGEPIGLLLLSRKEGLLTYSGHDIQYLEKCGLALGFALNTLGLLETLQAHSRESVTSSHRERRRIFNRLHDEPLKILPAATNLVRKAKSEAPHPCLDQAISYLEQVNSQIRSILNDLPPSLRNQGVYHIVDTGTDKFAESTFINVHKFISVPEGLDMSEDACSAIFFVLSGALENIERHSGAQSAAVVVRPVGAAIQLAILDNGRGFSAPQTALGAMRSSRAGLRFMYDWADAVGGALQITSVQGRSTRVVLTVPTEGNGKK